MLIFLYYKTFYILSEQPMVKFKIFCISLSLVFIIKLIFFYIIVFFQKKYY